MSSQTPFIKVPLLVAIGLATLLNRAALGQTAQKPSPDQGEVIRVNTELVQTDAMVFDKQGRFVDNLHREDFELKIDGKTRPIQFFERVTAGRDEESQLAAARGSAPTVKLEARKGPVPLDRGRTILFYIDDLHLSLSSVAATRKLITRFLEDQMGQNDEAAIFSASGQLGFLQQLTDNKMVLRAALGRLNSRPYYVRDSERPPMTEYQALLIDGYDRDVSDYFVEELLRENPGISRESALETVRARAQMILQQANVVTRNTLAGLESVVRAANKLLGRKLVFLISDGFFLDIRNSDSSQRLQQITSAAARSGVVIYSMDARGLVASLTDASQEVAFDPSGRLERASHSELLASQDMLNALARDTGGKPVFNTNDLKPGLIQALKETSLYYLLAWQPEQEGQSGRFRKIEVSIAGRPDLTVRVRRGFFDLEPPLAVKKSEKKTSVPPTPSAELADALRAPFPERRLPISLALNYLNTPDKGPLLSASMHVARELLVFASNNGKNEAVLDIAGTLYNSQGRAGAHFDDRIMINGSATDGADGKGRDVVFNYPVQLPPGLYQVRVAARDRNSERTGSAQAWIEIPDLKDGLVHLSSLIIGERVEGGPTTSPASQNELVTANLSVDHVFRGGSYLRFLVFVYNAAVPPGANPDLAAQIQIVRDNQPVMTTTLRKIHTEGTNLAAIPYAADVSLNDMPTGLYLLQLTVIDRVSKKSATQQTRFEIR